MLLIIMPKRVPHLKNGCGDVPCKYGVRCALAIAGPEEAFSNLAPVQRCCAIAYLAPVAAGSASKSIHNANLHCLWHLDPCLLIWQMEETTETTEQGCPCSWLKHQY